MADETSTPQPVVDESSISPTRPDNARKNSLENHLLHRPDREELVQSLAPPSRLHAPVPSARS